MASIDAVIAREILDSRGNPTVEVEVGLDDGSVGRAAVPSGASTGAYEASSCVTATPSVTAARACCARCMAVEDEIAPELVGYDASEQRLIDQVMLDLDGTLEQGAARRERDPRGLAGGGAGRRRPARTFRCSATSADPNAHVLPVPMMNVLNGGAHADTNVDIQEFMIAPIGAATFAEALRWGAEMLPQPEVGAEGARAVHRAR